MSTKLELVVAAVVAELNGAGKPGGIPTTVRTRTTDLSASSLPASTVYPLKEEVAPVHGHNSGVVGRSLIVRVELVALATSTLTADQAVDPLCSWVGKALGGSRLGGLAIRCMELETTFVYEQTPAGSACRASKDFRIQYATAVNNPDSLT